MVRGTFASGSRRRLGEVGVGLTGDREALDQLIADWLPTVYAWCARLGAGRIDPEEAAHDAMMILVRRRSDIDDPKCLPAWLFATCRRVVANHRRRAWLRRWLPGATLDHHAAPDRTDGRSDAEDLAAEVGRALDRLSAEHREVLVLCYLEDRSIAEAGELIGIPPGTVKSRLFVAREKFHASFARSSR